MPKTAKPGKPASPDRAELAGIVIEERAAVPPQLDEVSAGMHLLRRISQRVLDRMGFEAEQLRRLKQLEAHTSNLVFALASLAHREPVPKPQAQAIIETAIRQAALYRKTSKLSRENKEGVKNLEADLRDALGKLNQRAPLSVGMSEHAVRFSPDVLENARRLHDWELRRELGRKATTYFRLYNEAAQLNADFQDAVQN